MPILRKGHDEMKMKKTKVEQAVETDSPALEGRQMAAENEEGGYATIEEIRRGLFGFMPAITRHMHSPGSDVDDRKRQSSEE